MLAWQHYEAEFHGRCGQPKAVAFHPDSEGRFDGVLTVCHACAAMDSAQRKLRGNDEATNDGMLVDVVDLDADD